MKSLIITKFIEKHGEEFGLTEQQLVDLCETPFRYMKEVFKRDDLPEYRLKYLGTFKARPSNLHSVLKKTNVALEKGRITEEYHKQTVEPIKNKLSYYEENPYT